MKLLIFSIMHGTLNHTELGVKSGESCISSVAEFIMNTCKAF